MHPSLASSHTSLLWSLEQQHRNRGASSLSSMVGDSKKKKHFRKQRDKLAVIARLRREDQLNKRIYPNHTISPPLSANIKSRRVVVPESYQEAFRYYKECTGGDPYIEVISGQQRCNITRSTEENGAWSKQLIPKGYRFPMLGELLNAPPKKSKGHVHVVQLPQCQAAGKSLYLDATNCLFDVGYLFHLPPERANKMCTPLAIGPAINCPSAGGKPNVRFVSPPEPQQGIIKMSKHDIQWLETTEEIRPYTELLVDYGENDIPLARDIIFPIIHE